MMGRSRDELLPGLRSFPFGRYILFYLPLTDGVDLIRVLHSARDIDAVFSSDPIQ
jgi:toxin ParE1/3/4